MADFLTKRKIGDEGEKVAEKFLKKNGYSILERNYLKKWGEIDIIAKKEGIICFVEVKAMDASRNFLPEQNVNIMKQRRLIRAAQSYLMENKLLDAPWQIDVIIVNLNYGTRLADVRHIKNAVWEK